MSEKEYTHTHTRFFIGYVFLYEQILAFNVEFSGIRIREKIYTHTRYTHTHHTHTQVLQVHTRLQIQLVSLASWDLLYTCDVKLLIVCVKAPPTEEISRVVDVF